MRPSLGFVMFGLVFCLAGCASLGDWAGAGGKAPPAAPPAAPSAAEVVSGHLEIMNRLGSGSIAQQAEIAEAARKAFLDAPGANRQLAYACVLATPGHGRSDPAGARKLLGDMLGAPEHLLPAERTLAQIVYREVNARLSLESELRELRTATDSADRERATAANRRLQAQIAENARLKKELDDALAKLEAVAELEKSLVNRQAPNGERP